MSTFETSTSFFTKPDQAKKSAKNSQNKGKSMIGFAFVELNV
jgi:hypothetical protein